MSDRVPFCPPLEEQPSFSAVGHVVIEQLERILEIISSNDDKGIGSPTVGVWPEKISPDDLPEVFHGFWISVLHPQLQRRLVLVASERSLADDQTHDITNLKVTEVLILGTLLHPNSLPGQRSNVKPVVLKHSAVCLPFDRTERVGHPDCSPRRFEPGYFRKSAPSRTSKN